jgi:hypothetical protein
LDLVVDVEDEGVAEMPWNVFLSFVEEDLHMVEMWREQEQHEDINLEFYDYPAKKPFDGPDAENIKSDIKEQLQKSSVTVVLIGRTTYASKWVDWEIRASVEMGKGLLAVDLHADSEHIVPRALKDFRVEIFGWDIKETAIAIEREARQSG